MDPHDDETATLYRELSAFSIGAGKRRRGFPKALKRRVAEHVKLQVGAGRLPTHMATALGISKTTLARWMTDARPGSAFREVSLMETPAPACSHQDNERAFVVIHAQSGLRIEGLTVEAIAALVRALS
jgi:hypothetical protein